jgi:glycerol-3-phosphate acyltransferase PlsY
VFAARAWAPEAAPLCAVMVVLGHVWPAQLAWRGGKGVATAVGALVVLDLVVLGSLAVAFALLRVFLRGTVAAGIAAFWCAAALAVVLRPGVVALATFAIAALLTFTHRRDLWPSKLHV